MAARECITVGEWQAEVSRAMQHYKIAPPTHRLAAVAQAVQVMSEKGELATAAKLAAQFPNRNIPNALRALWAQGRILRAVKPRGNQPAAYVYNPNWREKKDER